MIKRFGAVQLLRNKKVS